MERKLHNIKKTGFKIPDGYFEGLEDSILSQAKLSNITNAGFKIPNGYLDSLEDKIINTVSKNDDVKVIKLFSKRNIIYASSIAATILLLFNLSVFKQNPTYDSLEMATIENYILNEDIDMDQIASLLTQEELTEENFIDTNYSEENMETYILNHVDIEDYISE
jgi:uncharacterized membrane protein YvbJ